jgi:hypothetical protein
MDTIYVYRYNAVRTVAIYFMSILATVTDRAAAETGKRNPRSPDPEGQEMTIGGTTSDPEPCVSLGRTAERGIA